MRGEEDIHTVSFSWHWLDLFKDSWKSHDWLLSFAIRFFRQRLDICITRNSGNLAFSVPINLEALLINYLILSVLVISIIRKPCWFILLISICNLIYWWWLDNAEKERVIKTFERIDTQHIIFLKNTRPNLQLYKVWQMNIWQYCTSCRLVRLFLTTGFNFSWYRDFLLLLYMKMGRLKPWLTHVDTSIWYVW